MIVKGYFYLISPWDQNIDIKKPLLIHIHFIVMSNKAKINNNISDISPLVIENELMPNIVNSFLKYY